MIEFEKQDENRRVKLLDRGMTSEEVQALLTAPIGNREQAFSFVSSMIHFTIPSLLIKRM